MTLLGMINSGKPSKDIESRRRRWTDGWKNEKKGLEDNTKSQNDTFTRTKKIVLFIVKGFLY